MPNIRSYIFQLGAAPKAKDSVIEFDDVRAYVDPKSYPFLDGLTFVWHNPNAKRSCSCGKSFTV